MQTLSIGNNRINIVPVKSKEDALSKINSAMVKLGDVVYWPNTKIEGTYGAMQKTGYFTIDLSKAVKVPNTEELKGHLELNGGIL